MAAKCWLAEISCDEFMITDAMDSPTYCTLKSTCYFFLHCEIVTLKKKNIGVKFCSSLSLYF